MALVDINRIQNMCLSHYNNVLSKSGKANTNTEWTVLSAVVMSHESEYQVVSMGTGTKCIGQNSMCFRGLTVNDSHAEIVARRSFICFLFEQIEKSFEGKSSMLVFDGEKCDLKRGISFHFFTTHVPCGDASIIEKHPKMEAISNICSDNIGFSVNSIKNKNALDYCLISSKKFKNDIGEAIKTNKLYITDGSPKEVESKKAAVDIYRTGAKCVTSQDPMQKGLNYHLKGVLRTKPGRGDKTHSHSCSDKLCKWNVLGIQGALIMHFLRMPIYLDSFIIASDIFCEKAFIRATYDKLSGLSNLSFNFKVNRLRIFHLEESHFLSKRVSKDQNSCPNSICWFASDKSPNHEVIARGRLLGLTKKCKDSGKSCFISKASLFKKFLSIKGIYLGLCPNSNLNDEALKTYCDYKNASLEYQQTWRVLKESYLGGWICSNEKFNQFQ